MATQMIQSQSKFLMGVLNVTPNSFSDGGQYNQKESCLSRIEDLLSQKVSYLDCGAESTAPFNKACSFKDECNRFEDTLFPALVRLSKSPKNSSFFEAGTLSIDTYRPETFHFVASYIRSHWPGLRLLWNDVSGVLDDDTLYILNSFSNCDYVYCHNLAPTRNETQNHKSYFYKGSGLEGPFMDHLYDYFNQGLDFFHKESLSKRVILDPCFGFSKTMDQNKVLLKHLIDLVVYFPKEVRWLIGISRKSFLQDSVKGYRKGSKGWDAVESLHCGLLSLWFQKLWDYTLIFRVHEPHVYYGALQASSFFPIEGEKARPLREI